MRAVDTNVLVRLVTGDDLKQAAAAEKFVSTGAWVSHLVLAETIWVLSTVYDRDPPALAQTVDFLLKHRDLTIQDAEVVVAALVQSSSDRVEVAVGAAEINRVPIDDGRGQDGTDAQHLPYPDDEIVVEKIAEGGAIV